MEEKRWQQHNTAAPHTPLRITPHQLRLTMHTRTNTTSDTPGFTLVRVHGHGHERAGPGHAGEATRYLSRSVKEDEALRNVCRLSSEARARGSARERGGAAPRERGAGCWEQLRS